MFYKIGQLIIAISNNDNIRPTWKGKMVNCDKQHKRKFERAKQFTSFLMYLTKPLDPWLIHNFIFK